MAMKLYATVASERAKKGQGGNKFIAIELMSGSADNSVLEYSIEYTTEGISVYDADANCLLKTGQIKGEKQKGECGLCRHGLHMASHETHTNN